jgi:hypothetical protein
MGQFVTLPQIFHRIQSVQSSLMVHPTKPLNRIRYGFKGACYDWWDWGPFCDHEETVDWTRGKVIKPLGSGGKGQLVASVRL